MSTGRAVLTVSELTRRLQEVLEDRFPAVWVEGEISNFRLYGSGHAYFTTRTSPSRTPTRRFAPCSFAIAAAGSSSSRPMACT